MTDAPAPPADKRSLLAEGRAAIRAGDAAAGVDHLRAALALDPTDIGLHGELGWELLKLGRIDDAGATCRAGLALAPDNADLLLRQGLVLRRGGDRAAALDHFRAALRSRPDHGWALQELAAELIQANELDEAEATLHALLAAQPGNAHAQIRLGVIARRRGDHPAALAHFEAAHHLAPADAWASIELATALRDSARPAEAVALLDRLTGPPRPEALRQRGLALMDTGDHAAARDSFATALAANPASIQASIDLAQAERALGLRQAAQQRLDAALAREPRSIGLLNTLIGWRRQDGDLEAAVALCHRAIEAQPEQPWLHGLLAGLLGAAGANAAAEATLAAALARFGPEPGLIQERAQHLRRRGAPGAALALLRDLPEEATRGSFPLWFQGRELELTLGELGLVEAALAAPPPVRAGWQEANLLQLRGQLASARWDLGLAEACFTQAAAAHPGNGLAQHELGRLALLRLDLPEARAALTRWMRMGTPPGARRRGAWNLSQSLPGQLTQEFALCRDTLAALQAIQAAPPLARIDPLRQVVAARPEQTSAAIMLLVSLRLAGLLDTPSPTGAWSGADGAVPIPRRIVQFWTAAEPDADLLPLMRSWPEMNPGHAYHRFDNDSAAAYLRDRHAPAIGTAFRQARQPAQRADLFRLAFLAAEGGIWADADDRCLAPLSSIIDRGARLVAYQEDFGSVGNNLLAVAPGHPAVLAALELAAAAVLRGDGEMIWLSTGPGLLSRALAQDLARSPLPVATALRDVRLLTRAQAQRAVAMFTAVDYKRDPRSWTYRAFGAAGGAA